MDVILDAQQRFFNTLPLHSLLREADAPFRQAVIGALIREGFELDETVPCLQHPMDILQAIDWLETLEFGAAWESFREALLTAGKLGILLDLRAHHAKAFTAMPASHTGWMDGHPWPQLESA